MYTKNASETDSTDFVSITLKSNYLKNNITNDTFMMKLRKFVLNGLFNNLVENIDS